jgi:Uncharacterised methyltransferase family (DUF6094)
LKNTNPFSIDAKSLVQIANSLIEEEAPMWMLSCRLFRNSNQSEERFTIACNFCRCLFLALTQIMLHSTQKQILEGNPHHAQRWQAQTRPFSASHRRRPSAATPSSQHGTLQRVGTGDALHRITADLPCRRYGIELDAERALSSSRSGIETVQGNLFDAHAKVESFSLLYLNPPYDSGIGTLNNQRMELLFVEHTYRWLVHGGVLLFVLPEKRLSMCIPLLAANFTGFRLFRLNDPESIPLRTGRACGGTKADAGGTRWKRIALCGNGWSSIRSLSIWKTSMNRTTYPQRHPLRSLYRGLPFDAIEDLIPHSPAWKQVAPFLLPKEEMASGRPITPLHAGHVGLLCTAGLLNGVFGDHLSLKPVLRQLGSVTACLSLGRRYEELDSCGIATARRAPRAGVRPEVIADTCTFANWLLRT